MTGLLSIIIQFVIVILIVVFLNFVAVKLMVHEDIVDDNSAKKTVSIFRGWVETNSFTNKKFNTYNPFAKNYRKLSPSMNRMGGAQFSYSFWLKLNNTSPENLEKKWLFIHGDPTNYNYTYDEQYKKKISASSPIVKCPGIGFGKDINEIFIECNTTNDFNESVSFWGISDLDETKRHNVLSLIQGKWALFTITFGDNKPLDEKEDRTQVKLFINDIEYHRSKDYHLKGALKLNQGNLTILPNSPIQSGYMADLTYYNYALNVEDIRKIYNKSFTNERYNEMDNDPDFNEPLYLTQYNKLDIYNL
jgi:hypothetical protein